MAKDFRSDVEFNGTLTANAGIGIAGGATITTGSLTVSIGSLTLPVGNISATSGTITASTASITGNAYLPATSSAGGSQIIAGNNDGAYLAVGASALQNYINGNAGTYSIAIGYGALARQRANTGGDNIAIGIYAHTASTGNPSQNVVVGNYAFGGNTALLTNFTGTGNTAIGYSAIGTASGTISNNTAIGVQAMWSSAISTTNNNTAIGANTMGNLTTGVRNTALGSLAGKTTTTGAYNVSIGYNIGPVSATSSGVVLIGNDSGATAAVNTADNQIVLGTSNHTTIIPGAASITGTTTLGTTNTGSFTATAASVGSNKVTTNDIIRGKNHTPSGAIDTISRLYAQSSQAMTASVAWYVFFTATETINSSSISLYTTTAGASNSLRFGLYTVSNAELASASLTLVARTASTAFTTTTANFSTRAFDTTGGFPASYTLTAGTRYAVGVIATSGPPSMLAMVNVNNGYAAVPIMARQQTAQSDITSAVSASSLASSNAIFVARILGTLA
jgi:hypothetical protein